MAESESDIKSQEAPHTSPTQASYGVPVVRIL